MEEKKSRMNEPAEIRWREKCWRRELSAAERRELRLWLESHPELKPEFELELSLHQALGTLKDVSVPSNFTSRLLQAVEREEAQSERLANRHRAGWWENFKAWMPRFGVGAVILVAGLLSYQQFQIGERQKMLDSVTAVAEVSTLPAPEILHDFDAIQAMTRTPGPDEELLALMK